LVAVTGDKVVLVGVVAVEGARLSLVLERGLEEGFGVTGLEGVTEVGGGEGEGAGFMGMSRV
jgi:hypothetical protein